MKFKQGEWRVVDHDENLVVFVGDYQTAKEVFNEGVNAESKVGLERTSVTTHTIGLTKIALPVIW